MFQKSALLATNGRTARRLLEQVTPYVARAAPGDTLWLRGSRAGRYSVFRMNDFDPLRYGGSVVQRITGRRDVRLVWTDAGGAERAWNRGVRTVLVVRNGRVEPFTGPSPPP